MASHGRHTILTNAQTTGGKKMNVTCLLVSARGEKGHIRETEGWVGA